MDKIKKMWCNLSLRKSIILYISAFVILAILLSAGTATLCNNANNDGFYLSVSDNGCGFSKNILSKATNPYFTEEENHSEHFGLGLYICKILCEHHGGYLKIENCSIGAKVTAFFKSLD